MVANLALNPINIDTGARSESILLDLMERLPVCVEVSGNILKVCSREMG